LSSIDVVAPWLMTPGEAPPAAAPSGGGPASIGGGGGCCICGFLLEARGWRKCWYKRQTGL